MHFCRVGVFEVLHEHTQRCGGCVFAIDIYDVSHVVERRAQLVDMPVNVVYGQSVSQYILGCDEDYIGFGQGGVKKAAETCGLK